MRDVPQLKLVREAQGWSQRDLAAKSGVAQNTISQLERGERQAMPSTVRKLANALGVEPPVLMAQSDQQREEQEEQSASVETMRGGKKILRYQYSGQARQPSVTSDIVNFIGEFDRERSLERKEWYETGRWAEYYVSGELVNRARAFAEAHDAASILSEYTGGSLVKFLSDPERQYLEDIRLVLGSFIGDLAAVRSRLASNDPKDTVIAAQTVLGKAKRIIEEHEGYLRSYRRISERYYEPEAYSRILKLEKALSEQREAAAVYIRTLMDLYDECLDALEDQILGMRKESDVLEQFLTQTPDRGR